MFRQLRKSFTGVIMFSIVVLVSCINADKEKANNTDPGHIYFDYKITGEEGDDNLTVMLQYREGGEDGDAIAPGGKVMLDEEMLEYDSTKMGGFFYELHKPIAAFTGKHHIVYTGTDKKEYKEEFEFRPVVLLTVLGDTLPRSEMIVEFEGLEPEDHLRVVLTDTSYYNDGINRVDTVINGRLVITRSDLESLAPGPIQLNFIREFERPVKNGTEEGGRLQIVYSLHREFFLKDQP
jgi:8-oxo-dGTP pyrophosphatase MutT (NUDIX family)